VFGDRRQSRRGGCCGTQRAPPPAADRAAPCCRSRGRRTSASRDRGARVIATTSSVPVKFHAESAGEGVLGIHELDLVALDVAVASVAGPVQCNERVEPVHGPLDKIVVSAPVQSALRVQLVQHRTEKQHVAAERSARRLQGGDALRSSSRYDLHESVTLPLLSLAADLSSTPTGKTVRAACPAVMSPPRTWCLIGSNAGRCPAGRGRARSGRRRCAAKSVSKRGGPKRLIFPSPAGGHVRVNHRSASARTCPCHHASLHPVRIGEDGDALGPDFGVDGPSRTWPVLRDAGSNDSIWRVPTSY